MVDASIGGKTGCDFENYKNMIGSFFPAQQIHIYPEFVQSLSKEQYRSGLAEALKTALLYDKDLYQIIKTEKTKIFFKKGLTNAFRFGIITKSQVLVWLSR